MSDYYDSSSSSSCRDDDGTDYSVTNYSTVDDDRVILLMDMDCFEVQVHQEPWMNGKPRVVANSQDRILAVSYEAKRHYGINRDDTPYVRAAVARCPKLIVIPAPSQPNGRPNQLVKQEATERIKEAIRNGLSDQGLTEGNDFVFEYSSPDEFYVELTPYLNSGQGRNRLSGRFLSHASDHLFDLGPLIYFYTSGFTGEPLITPMRHKMRELAVTEACSCGGGWTGNPQWVQERRLIMGAYIAARMVEHVKNETGYQSSVGVGSNKVVAKIAGGRHKPGSITIASPLGFKNFAHQVKVKDVPGLGGGVGKMVMDEWDLDRMGHFHRVKHGKLTEEILNFIPNFSWEMATKKATKILDNVNGLCSDRVVPVEHSESVSSGFEFRGNNQNFTRDDLQRYVENDVCSEYAAKLRFEAKWHQRLATRVKMTIRVEDGPSITAITNKDQPSDVRCDELYDALLEDEPPSGWPHRLIVREINIVATHWRRVRFLE